MKSIDTWLNEYAASHRNPRNKILHRICVPAILLSALGLLRMLSFGDAALNGCTIAMALMLLYYGALSWRLSLGMVLMFALIYVPIELSWRTLGGLHAPLMIAVFVIAWIGQFIGHEIEGAKPSFFKDLQFLLIGPLWLLADLYRRLSLPVVRSGAVQS